MNIRFLGSGASIPDVNNDCPCFLINDTYLVDCGYDALKGLRKAEKDISKIKYIIFTHMHHDHYIGLAGLLFFMLQSGQKDIGDLTFIGPETMPEVLQRTYSFLQLDKFFSVKKYPEEIILSAGEHFENDEIILKASSCYHPVEARAYAIKEKNSGKLLAISGDTAYKEDLIEIFSGADVLIHDCTLGYNKCCDDPATRSCGHSSIFEAIKLCEKADVSVLFSMHMNDDDCRKTIDNASKETKVKLMFPSRDFDFILY